MKVEGMTCTGCEEHVTKALKDAGANHVTASFRKGEARFHVPHSFDLTRLSNAVEQTGIVLGRRWCFPAGNRRILKKTEITIC
jgi:copper chaperone CopZ